MNQAAQSLKRALVTLFLLGSIVGPVGSARADDDAGTVEARKQFRAGVNLLDDPDGAKYEEAYHAFKKAHALSHNPKVLGNIGFCAMHLERDGEAIEAYAAYLRDATGVDDRERAQIERDLATLTSTVATVRIVVRHPGTSFQLIDTRMQTRGSSIENSYPLEGNEVTLRIRPGRHAFKAKAGAVDSVLTETAIEPASTTTQQITFAPPRSLGPLVVRDTPSYAGPVILGAAGLVSLGAATATGLLARGKKKEIEDRCPGSVCPLDYDLDDVRRSARTFATVADAAFIGGGVLVGGALVWYLLVPKARTSTSATTAGAMCSSVGCNVQLGRAF